LGERRVGERERADRDYGRDNQQSRNSRSHHPLIRLCRPLKRAVEFSFLLNPGWRASRLPWAIVLNAFSVPLLTAYCLLFTAHLSQ
jgi:hypothetical protein